MIRLAVLSGLVLATCAFAPNGIEPLTPPAHYFQVYEQAVDCTAPFRSAFRPPRPYSRIVWSVVPGHDFPSEGKIRALGHWEAPNGIAIAGDWVNIDWVVRHELVHYLLQRAHWSGDEVVFGVACHATWGYLDDDPNYKP